MLHLLLYLYIFSLQLLSSAYTPPDNYFIDCGSNSNTTISDGRVFIGDLNPPFPFSPGESKHVRDGKMSNNKPSLYQTARVYRDPSAYEIEVGQNGTYMVRLHFFSFGNLSKAIFDVWAVSPSSSISASRVSLLTNFSVQNTSTCSPVIKEFLLTLNEGKLRLYFVPSQESPSLAFINAIEVFSVPENFLPKFAVHVTSAGSNGNCSDLRSSVFRTVHRVIVGGPAITADGDFLWRTWVPHDRYLITTEVPKSSQAYNDRLDHHPEESTKYSLADYAYKTSKGLNENYSKQATVSNITWQFPVNKNASQHLVRVHFRNVTNLVPSLLDLYLFIHGNSVRRIKMKDNFAAPVFIDFVVDSDGFEFIDISINLRESSVNLNAILNGLEIFEIQMPSHPSPVETLVYVMFMGIVVMVPNLKRRRASADATWVEPLDEEKSSQDRLPEETASTQAKEEVKSATPKQNGPLAQSFSSSFGCAMIMSISALPPDLKRRREKTDTGKTVNEEKSSRDELARRTASTQANEEEKSATTKQNGLLLAQSFSSRLGCAMSMSFVFLAPDLKRRRAKIDTTLGESLNEGKSSPDRSAKRTASTQAKEEEKKRTVTTLSLVFEGFKRWKERPTKAFSAPLNEGRSSQKSLGNSIASRLNLSLKISYAEIQRATDNFNKNLLIGEGGFGKVYKGTLQLTEEIKVAVKRFRPGHGQGLTEFQKEIKLLSQTHFRHLVSLIGYCNERSEMIVVYEFMEKGCLRDHLYDPTSKFERSYSQSRLSWEQRLEICIGVAKGLHYLHTCLDDKIIHHDVKSTKILLDENYNAKISDFGLSTAVLLDPDNYSMVSKGSWGYIDPEYILTSKITEKSDVYAFGVVLLEVICARPAIFLSSQEEKNSLVEWGMLWQRKGKLQNIIDPVLEGQINLESLKKVSKLAEKCLNLRSDRRPTMREVECHLKYALNLQQTSGRCEVLALQTIQNLPVQRGNVTSHMQNLALPTVQNLPLQRGNTTGHLQGVALPIVQNMTLENKFAERTSIVYAAPNLNLLNISFAEIQQATNDFDEKFWIGEGAFGRVYKGTLQGNKVAVKRSEPRHGQGLMEFETEIKLLSQLCHPHLISLIGYCDERSEMILVYEYMEKGTLRDHLYGPLSAQSTLSWEKRLQICIGAATGLHYLHSRAEAIIHCDVKSTNILLDEHYVAKVADFGLSKLGHTRVASVSTVIKGSFGYFDPEYLLTAQSTVKSDVYAFGVVLLEVICARPAINASTKREEVNLAEWGMFWQRKGQLEMIMDNVLVGKVSPSSLQAVGELTERCLRPNCDGRPTMQEAESQLKYALKLQQSSVHGESNEESQSPANASSKPIVQHMPSKTFHVERDSFSALVTDQLPAGLRQYISRVKDVIADGNCGFRAIADLMGMSEDGWVQVRTDLLKELQSHSESYAQLYGSIEELTHALSFFKGGAPPDRWMIMPDMGHLIASCYNVVLFHLSMQQCLTFLPLRSAPVDLLSRRYIAIGFINGNHYVFLSGDHPIPPVANNWYRYHYPCANGWESTYNSRIQHFRQVIPPSVATMETIE